MAIWCILTSILEYAISALQWVLVTKRLRALLATLFFIVLANLLALNPPPPQQKGPFFI